MKKFAFAFCLGLVASPALAQTCPDATDHADAMTALITAAQDAPDENSAREISNQMWEIWADAPDAHALELLNEGMSRRDSYDFAGAEAAFNALVDYCPHYAEGYNQRAFVNFLRQDFEAALPDLERTLELSPRHVAALTGQALTLAALNRNGEAALILRAALKLNPWLSERHLLTHLEKQEQEL